jgi:Ser/Thr protein kinase RdoA (MazF antagonist)
MVPIDLICSHFHLGRPNKPIKTMQHNGHHALWFIHTDLGQFVLKQLSQTDQNLSMIRRTQNIARHYKLCNLPVLPAIILEDKSFFEWNNSIFLAFPFLEGQVLSRDCVQSNHIKYMAKLLGKIHQYQPSLLPSPDLEIYSLTIQDWQPYCSDPWLIDTHKNCLKACASILSDTVTSHRDLNLNNIIWQQDYAWIIDWDWAGKISRTQDVIATALNMSLNSSATINLDLFKAFIKHYPFTLVEQEIIPGLYRVLANWLNWCHQNLSQNIQQNPTTYSLLASHHVSDNSSELAELIFDLGVTGLKPSTL